MAFMRVNLKRYILMGISFVLFLGSQFSYPSCPTFAQTETMIDLQPMWKTGQYWHPESYKKHVAKGVSDPEKEGWKYAVDFCYIPSLQRPDTYRLVGKEDRTDVFAPHAGLAFIYLVDVTNDVTSRVTKGEGAILFKDISFDEKKREPNEIPTTSFAVVPRNGGSKRYIDVELVLVSNDGFSTFYVHLEIASRFFTDEVKKVLKEKCEKIWNGETLHPTPISTGEKVNVGERIGTIHRWGMANYPHLHFEVRRGDQNAGTDKRIDLTKVRIGGQPILLDKNDSLCWEVDDFARPRYCFTAMPRRNLQAGTCVVVNTIWENRKSVSLNNVTIEHGLRGRITSGPQKKELWGRMHVGYLVRFDNGLETWIPGAYLDECAPGPVPSSVSATILVMDVSGSMSWQWRGGVKIESAKKAALQFIEQVANEPRPPGVKHMIGVVTFSDSAELRCPLTDNYDEAKKIVISLGTIAWTNLGAGLDLALQELEKLPSAQKFIILLTDGMTNRGKSREEILATSVATARAKEICIHTVGFGDPGDIDEDFLRKIATNSGCGSYNYASSGFELFGTYIKIRHRMLGSNRIAEFTPDPPTKKVTLLPGQTLTLGGFQVIGPAKELHYTLAWSEPGKMRIILVDPSGRQVNRAYPGVTIYSGNGFEHVTVLSPSQGIWRVSAAAVTSFMSGVQYYGVVSARTGGIVIPYHIPTPCFTVLGKEICVPLPDMPTVVVISIALAVAALMFYRQLLG